MDGLPIKEETGLAFSSTNGNMHACGHDGHMAILLSVAKILSQNLDIFSEMLFDSTKTKSYTDKIKVWFSSPKWRPADVEKEYPIFKNDLDNFEPYNPDTSSKVKIYGWVQMIFLLSASASITATLQSQTYLETSIFAFT